MTGLAKLAAVIDDIYRGNLNCPDRYAELLQRAIRDLDVLKDEDIDSWAQRLADDVFQ